jgi:Holliday junction resolvase
MNTKAKGTKGERELIHAFHKHGFSAIRSAGSGSQGYPSPDILAGNAIRRLAVECKVTKDKKKYFPEEEIAQLRLFSAKFGAESWIGVRFPAEPWYFLMLEDLDKTGNSWAISLDSAKRKGLLVEELLQKDDLNRKV